MAKKKIVKISYRTLIAIVISSVAIISALLLVVVALLASNEKTKDNPLAYLAGTYKFDHTGDCKVGYICYTGNDPNFYIKLEENGQCYSNIIMEGKEIGACSWKQDSRKDGQICMTWSPRTASTGRMPGDKNSYNSQCLEYGDNFLDFLSQIFVKE